MRITEIRISQKKNLGNYENRELGFTAALDENEKPNEAIERVRNLLDWEINRPERDANHAAYTKRVVELEGVTGDDADKERRQIERWFAKYESRKAEIEVITT